MTGMTLFAATGDAVARVSSADGERFATDLFLEGSGAQCVAVDPGDPQRVYVGTFDAGVYRTHDGGAHWEQVGAEIPHQRALSVAVGPGRSADGRSTVYVGTEPSELFISEDDGQSWQGCPQLPQLPSAGSWSFPPRPWTHHVRWIAPDHHDPALIFVGIELGGVMRSRDGGMTWEDRKAGTYHDSHALATHSLVRGRVYEAAGGGVSLSRDGGDSWTPVDGGMDRHYVWGLTVDPADAELWYVSASYGPRQAHGNQGAAQGVIFRKRGAAPWEALGGEGRGLAQVLPYMPYALLTLRGQPGVLLAGLQNGTIMRSDDCGESWRQLPVQLPGLLALSES